MFDTKEISLNEINGDEFIERLKANDERAFSKLFSFIVPKLCSFLSSKFNLSEENGEEAAADTMIKVHKALSDFNSRGDAKLSTWIFRIAQNTAIDFIRLQKKQTENSGLAVELDESATNLVAEKTAKQWFRNKNTAAFGISSKKNKSSPQATLFNRALENLSEQDKSILLLRQNMEYEEIAESENANINALRTRYSRAFERLRREVEKEENL